MGLRGPGAGEAPAAHGQIADADRGALDMPHAYVTVASGPYAPAVARAGLGSWLDGRVSDRTLRDAMLVVSELVTNSVLHAHVGVGAPVQLRANLAEDVLRLEVADVGAATDVVRIRAPDSQDAGGFGLEIVGRVTARWGVVHGGGTRVWCELALTESD